MNPPIELRPIVRAFAEAMEAKLQQTDWKGGWDDVNMFWLTAKAAEELGEWSRNLIRNTPKAEEAVDLANIAMMLWHKAIEVEGGTMTTERTLDQQRVFDSLRIRLASWILGKRLWQEFRRKRI